MYSPKTLLLSRAERQLGGGRGMLVHTGERKVDEDPTDLPGSDVIPLQLRKGLQRELSAVRTLEIRHLINGHWRLGGAFAAALQGLRCSSTLTNEGNRFQSEGECGQADHPEASEESTHLTRVSSALIAAISNAAVASR